jgi:gliding-associated putative ABC transporter substrate-binding component GldG
MKRTSILSTVGILLVVAVLVLLNLIANTAFVRLDLTDGKVYSLSKASKKVVGNLQEPLTVKVYASKNLSPQLNDVKRYLNDLLSDYRTYGHGKFRYEFIDPGSDDKLEKEAQRYRIPPFQENVWNKDKLELKRVYLGMVMLHEDKQEAIPTIQSTNALEYNITSIIKRMTDQQDRTVGFVTGHGEPDLDKEMSQLAQLLRSNYQVETVDLASGVPDVNKYDALLLVAPTTEVPDSQLVLLDQYLMNGGGLGLFFSPVNADLQHGYAAPRGFNLTRLTAPYGFSIMADLVADQNANMINIQERRGFFTIQNTVAYPFFPNVATFTKDQPIVSDLDLVSLFFASEIDTSLRQKDAQTVITPLMMSSNKSMVQKSPFNIGVDTKWLPAQFNEPSKVLAVAVEGPFASAWKDRPVQPTWAVRKDSMMTGSLPGARIVVVGDGNFLRDAYMTTPSNLYFVLNSVDWLSGDTDLIQLRSREVASRPLAEISDSQRSAWKYFNWFVPPLAAVLIGLVYWQLRRRRRKREA